MKDLAGRPMPSHTMVSGIQDTGGIGRIISKMGRRKLSAPRYQPISQPRGTPMTTASRKPRRATCKLDQIWTVSTAPSGLGSDSLVTKRRRTSKTSHRILESTMPDRANPSQMSRKRRIPAKDRVMLR